jgi:hypothetical protein
MTTSTPNHRWFHLTPARFFVGLLAVQVFLFLSERLQWFWFNEQKGWTVLIAIGVVGVAVVVMLLWGLVCLLLRGRFQFGVRSLLVFLLAVSVPLGWFAWEMQRARRQREVVEAIVGMGGWVYYDYQLEKGMGRPNPHAEPATPAWFRRLLGDNFFCDAESVYYGDDDLESLVIQLRELPYLEALHFLDTHTTVVGVEHLPALRNLERLSIRVSDDGLDQLATLAGLKWLDISQTQITDDGLARLTVLTNLETLGLFDTQITDVGLSDLRRLTNLRFLGLSGTEITDEGLKHLRELSNLQWLFLEETQVTENGVKKLQQALPNCRIYHDHT